MWSDLGSRKVTLAGLQNRCEKANMENGRPVRRLSVTAPTRTAAGGMEIMRKVFKRYNPHGLCGCGCRR